MPTWVANTDAVINFDNSGGTLVDQSDFISSIALDVANAISTFYTFGLDGGQTTEGNLTWTGTMGVRPATDPTGAHQDLIDWLTPAAAAAPGARSVRIQEPDAVSGSIQWDAEIRISQYNAISQDADGDGSPSIRSVSFSVDGVPTLTVIS